MDNLTLQPRLSKLHSITLHEKVDVNVLTKLIHISLLKPMLLVSIKNIYFFVYYNSAYTSLVGNSANQ